MKREEEIEKLSGELFDMYLDTDCSFLEIIKRAIKWADEHPNQHFIVKYLIRLGYIVDLNGNIPKFEEICKQFENFVNYKKTLNPWRDAKKDPPKDGEWCLFKFTTPSWSHGLYEARQMPNMNMSDYIENGEIIGWMHVPETQKGDEK